MNEPESKSNGEMTFKRDLRALFERYPVAKFGFLFLFNFAFYSFKEALFPGSHQAYSYGGHVVAVAWQSVVFSAIFFFVFRKRHKP